MFVTLLFVFAYVGHFLFAFAMPEEFGTVWDSVQATIKMMNGEISFQALETAYHSAEGLAAAAQRRTERLASGRRAS